MSKETGIVKPNGEGEEQNPAPKKETTQRRPKKKAKNPTIVIPVAQAKEMFTTATKSGWFKWVLIGVGVFLIYLFIVKPILRNIANEKDTKEANATKASVKIDKAFIDSLYVVAKEKAARTASAMEKERGTIYEAEELKKKNDHERNRDITQYNQRNETINNFSPNDSAVRAEFAKLLFSAIEAANDQ